MGKSIQQIADANKAFYMSTYARRITRSNFGGMIIFFIIWSIELILLKISLDKVYYFDLARAKNLANQEIKDWVDEQVWQNVFSWESAVVLAMILAIAYLLIHFWKMKRYELHKNWKKMFNYPLLVVVVGNILLLFLLLQRGGTHYIVKEMFWALFNVIAYLPIIIKLLFPLEVKKNEERDWKVFGWIGRTLDVVESKIDIAKWIIDKL